MKRLSLLRIKTARKENTNTKMAIPERMAIILGSPLFSM